MTDPWLEWWKDLTFRLRMMTSTVVLHQLGVLAVVLILAFLLDRILARYKARWLGHPPPIRYRMRTILWSAKYPFFVLVLGNLALAFYRLTGRPAWTLNQLVSLFWFLTGYALLARGALILIPVGDARRLIRWVFLPLLAILGALHLVGLLPVIWSWAEQSAVPLATEEFSLASVAMAIAIVIGFWLVARLAKFVFLSTVLHRTHADAELARSVATFVQFAIVIVGFWFAIVSLGVESSNLTLLISALTVGIGFGLQDVIKNVMGGVILLGEGHVRPAEIFEIAGETGVVQRIGLRSTTVRTWDGSLVIIPNADLIAEKVADLTDVLRIDITVGISCDADPRQGEQLLLQIASDHRNVVDDPAPSVYFTNLGDSTFDLTLYCYVGERSQLVQTKSDLHFAIVETFRQRDVDLPYRQIDLHLRSGPWQKIAAPQDS
jgi:small-conductance mechanosensitive channel